MTDNYIKCYTCKHNPETCNPPIDCPKDEKVECWGKGWYPTDLYMQGENP